MEHATFAEMLRERAERQPDATAFEFLEEERTIGYAELDARARSIAAGIQASLPAGERVLVTLPPGEAYVSGVFGCLYAGAVAVPAYPADPAQPERASARLRAIAADARPAAVLTADPADGAALAPVVLAPAAPDDWRPAGARPTDVALLQYTSGSTASPRGVMVTHANLLHNSELIRRAFGHSPESRGVSLAAAVPRHGADRRRAATGLRRLPVHADVPAHLPAAAAALAAGRVRAQGHLERGPGLGVRPLRAARRPRAARPARPLRLGGGVHRLRAGAARRRSTLSPRRSRTAASGARRSSRATGSRRRR